MRVNKREPGEEHNAVSLSEVSMLFSVLMSCHFSRKSPMLLWIFRLRVLQQIDSIVML